MKIDFLAMVLIISVTVVHCQTNYSGASQQVNYTTWPPIEIAT
jgi:hypothetical protein